MEYNNIQNKLQDYISFYERNRQDLIKWDEYFQLERTYKNNYLVKNIKERSKYLHDWMHNIGKEVYLSHKGFNYALVNKFPEMDSLNQKQFTTLNKYIFSEEIFDRLCAEYCNYQVKRLTEELLEGSITSNSTCKMSNLVFEWNLECKQELIKVFRNLK